MHMLQVEHQSGIQIRQHPEKSVDQSENQDTEEELRELYKVSCWDREASYMGETGRTLQKRITEHKYVVKTNDRKNGIAMHAWDMEHRPDWDAAEVLETEPHD